MPRGKTIKKSRGMKAKPLTIPELRKSLDYVTSMTNDMLQSKQKSEGEMADIFAQEWMKVFGKKLPKDVATSYIHHRMEMLKGAKKGKFTRKNKKHMKHSGGAAPVSGAPLDYMTRPGLDIPYGKFLDYVSSGFTNPEPAAPWQTGRLIPVLPYADTGSNQVGGRLFLAENPPSVGQDLQTLAMGQSLGPGPSPVQIGPRLYK